MNKHNRFNNFFASLFPLFCGLFIFILYELTNAKGIYWGDSGEFITVSNSLGIGHAYGHPLFWLVGRIAILLNPSNPASAMNHLTAVFSSLTCIIVAMISSQFITVHISKLSRLIIIFIVTVIYGTASTVWTYATFTEVYNFQAFFIALSIYFFNAYLDRGEKISHLYASAYFFGIALTLGYYIVVILIFPILTLKRLLSRPSFIKRDFFLCLLFVFLGLSIFAYLPIRSALSPILARYDIHSFKTFFNYLTRAKYKSQDSAGSYAIGISIVQTFKIIILNLGIPGILLSIIAGWKLLKSKNKSSIYQLLLAALLCTILFGILIPMNLNFKQMVNMDAYFVPCLILFIAPLTAGTGQLILLLKNWMRPFILIPVFLLIILHIPHMDISKKNTSEVFSSYLLSNIPDHYLIYPVSDEIAYHLFYLIFTGNNDKDFSILGFKNNVDDFNKINFSKNDHILIEIQVPYLNTLLSKLNYQIAGPFLTSPKDSSISRRLDDEFCRQFSPEKLVLNNLSRIDRLSLARLWSKRGIACLYRYRQFVMDKNPLKTHYYQESLKSFQYAFQLDDFTFEGALHASNTAYVLATGGFYKQASQLAKQALTLNANAIEAHRILYTLAYKQKSYTKALQHLHQLSKYDPRKGDIFIDMSCLYTILNQKEKARQCYLKGIRLGGKPRQKLQPRQFF